jgi:Tfp pilus assembly protein PilX
MRPPSCRTSVRTPPGEAGSAYIIALLVLVVLTIVGLALTLITQTEVRIGANERTVNRTFYAADSGMSVAVAETLVKHNDQTVTFFLNTTLQDNPSSTAPTTFSDQITITPLFPIMRQPCNLCQINQGSDFFAITHVASSTTTRVGVNAGTQVNFAKKNVVAMISLQPWQSTIDALNDPNAQTTMKGITP